MTFKEICFNPFNRIAGARALLLGGSIMAITAIIAFFSNCHFDGVLDAHVGDVSPWWTYFVETLISWGIAVLLFYLAGRIFSQSAIRLIDIAGTVALARYPFIFIALVSFMVPAYDGPIPEITASLIAASLLMVLFIIWYIALLYHAVVISCNLQKKNRVPVFIGTLLLAEILSKMIFYYFYQI